MKASLYRQCTLEKSEGTGKTTRILWGPNEFVELNREVKVKEDNGEWSMGWKVVAVHGEPLPESIVVRRSHDYTKQRKASDI